MSGQRPPAQGWGRRVWALALGQGSLLVPGEQEAVEEVDGTLAVLLRLLHHQVGRGAQEEAGEQGGCRECQTGSWSGAEARNGARNGLCFSRGSGSGETHSPIMATLTLLSSEYLSSSRRNDIRYRNTLRWQRGSWKITCKGKRDRKLCQLTALRHAGPSGQPPPFCCTAAGESHGAGEP